MELTGKIISCLEKRSGTSPRTGNAWAVQSYVLEFSQGNYPRHMVFDVFGEDNIARYNIQAGETVTVTFYIDAREYNGRFYNSVRATAVTRPETVPAADNAMPYADQSPFGPSAPMPSAAPAAAPEQSSDNVDDLPF